MCASKTRCGREMAGRRRATSAPPRERRADRGTGKCRRVGGTEQDRLLLCIRVCAMYGEKFRVAVAVGQSMGREGIEPGTALVHESAVGNRGVAEGGREQFGVRNEAEGEVPKLVRRVCACLCAPGSAHVTDTAHKSSSAPVYRAPQEFLLLHSPWSLGSSRKTPGALSHTHRAVTERYCHRLCGSVVQRDVTCHWAFCSSPSSTAPHEEFVRDASEGGTEVDGINTHTQRKEKKQ